MAKYQACEFIRTRTSNKLRKDMMLKGKYPPKKAGWEKGIARVENFGTGDVEYIIDDTGRKLPGKEVHDFSLRSGLAYAVIDTDHNP